MSDTKVICRRSELVAVADATRSKTGRTDEMTLGEIASAIKASGGVDLPELDNPASADDIVQGKEAISELGEMIVGTNPYAKAETDMVVDEQTDLIEQIRNAVDELPEAGSGGEESAIELCTVNITHSDRKDSNIVYYTNANMHYCEKSLYLETNLTREIPKETIVIFRHGTITPSGNYNAVVDGTRSYVIRGDCAFSV